jgi:ABC-type transport system involved in multi-copper enzyme maturation permease subunit
MLPGPVFAFELMSTSRRGRFYLVRAFYGIVLFLILWSVHAAWTSENGAELPAHTVKFFAFSAYGGISVGQEILVLMLTPALVAGVVADEKQRKTLHYLLASRLTSPEIVIGKLLVRMLYVAVLLGVSLPVLSLLVLLGGIDPRLVLLACGATFSTAWFLAALSIWVSTIARRVREAFFVAYGLEALWLFSPFIFRNLPLSRWPIADNVVSWLAEWVGTSSPLHVARELLFGTLLGGGSRASDLYLVGWMTGLQSVFGLILAVLASWQLRPVFQRQEGGARAPWGLGSLWTPRRRWRLWRRPALGSQPMMWKELHTGGPRGLARFVGFLLTVIGGGFLVYYAVWLGMMAVIEAWDFGFLSWSDYTQGMYRIQFRYFLDFVVPLLYIVAMLGMAGAGAAAVTSEHEEDTWVSLTATDLTGREVIFAKLWGALSRGRRFSELILLLAIAGVCVGSISLLSIPLLVVALGVYGWFGAALGVWISLQLRSTWRAQFLTIACLILINVTGQGILNVFSRYGFAPQVWPGFTPYEIGKLLLLPDFPGKLASASWPSSWRISAIDEGLPWLTIIGVLSVCTYAALASFLTWHSLRRFEMIAGRASRTGQTRPAAAPGPSPSPSPSS